MSETTSRHQPVCVPDAVFASAKKGDQRSFELIFAAYHSPLVRYLRAVSPRDVDDLAAATWESVAKTLPRFEGDGTAFRGWLLTIARRRLVDHIRRAEVRPSTVALDVDVLESTGPSAPPADASLEGADWASWVLARIPPRQAEVIALRIVGGLSAAEVAEILDLTAENVRVLTHRGVVAMKACLEDVVAVELATFDVDLDLEP